MKRLMMATVLAAGVMAAGCSRSPEPEAAPTENADVTEIAPDEAQPAPAEAPPPAPEAPVNTVEADPLPPPEEPSADEQMTDDAFATGMTARADRDEDATANVR